MREFKATPVMHTYVYNYELAGNTAARLLVEKKLIRVVDYEEYLPKDRSHYANAFYNAYQSFNFKKLDHSRDIYTYQHQGESLGEIRTALMALYMNINVFMSDDREARTYVKNRISSSRHRIMAYGIYDTLMYIGKSNDRQLRWSEVKGLAKEILAGKQYDEINKMWHNMNCE